MIKNVQLYSWELQEFCSSFFYFHAFSPRSVIFVAMRAARFSIWYERQNENHGNVTMDISGVYDKLIRLEEKIKSKTYPYLRRSRSFV